MTAHPTLDLSQLNGSIHEKQVFLEALDAASRSNGFFYVVNHGIPSALTKAVLSQSQQFFDLGSTEKNLIHIRHSSNFRGYSEMKNARDWREQVHFGQELPFVTKAENVADCYQLVGSNLWPEALGAPFRDTMLAYLEATNLLGLKLLSAFAALLQLPADYFKQLSDEPSYLLMKLICYYAQPSATVDRPGVAPHCDWSWLTILLQDDVGGLEVLSPSGVWKPVKAADGVLSVNLGELMEILTKGRYVATAHRVINPSEEKRRISIPVFINPALDAHIEPLKKEIPEARQSPGKHIHRVIEQGAEVADFQFGKSEWQRKGLGQWCHNAGCMTS